MFVCDCGVGLGGMVCGYMSKNFLAHHHMTLSPGERKGDVRTQIVLLWKNLTVAQSQQTHDYIATAWSFFFEAGYVNGGEML